MNNFNNINKNNNKNPFFSIKTQTDNNTISTIPIENLIVINNIKSNSININKNKNNNNNNLNKKDNSIYKRSFPKNFTNKSRNNRPNQQRITTRRSIKRREIHSNINNRERHLWNSLSCKKRRE
jgi:hypothetical protein